MSIEAQMTDKLKTLEPFVLNVENESHRHAGPATDSHFKVTLVSRQFEGQLPIKRHRAVYALLEEEMAGPVHALSIHAYTPDEWPGEAPASPDCRGGSG